MTDTQQERPITRCPQCGTMFRVSIEQLKVADGKVRCGACLHTFEALDFLVAATMLRELPPPLIFEPESESKSEPETKTNLFEFIVDDISTTEATKEKPSLEANYDPIWLKKFDEEFPDEAEKDDFEVTINEELSRLELSVEDDFELELTSEPEDSLLTKKEQTDLAQPIEVLEEIVSEEELAEIEELLDEPSSNTEFSTIDEDNDNNADNFEITDEDKTIDSKPQQEGRDAIYKIANSFAAKILPKKLRARANLDDDLPDILLDELDGGSEQEYLAMADLLNEPKQPEELSRKGFWLVIALIPLFFIQIIVFKWDDWKNSASMRAVMNPICTIFWCELPPLRDIQKIQVINRALQEKDQKGNWRFELMIENTANFSQPYPSIHLKLFDTAGQILAEKIIYPKQYLNQENSEGLMPARIPIHIAFNLQMDVTEISGYEILFIE